MITRTSAPAGSTSGLTARVAALPRADKTLLKVLFGAALLALVLGLAGGFVTALARAGALTFSRTTPTACSPCTACPCSSTGST